MSGADRGHGGGTAASPEPTVVIGEEAVMRDITTYNGPSPRSGWRRRGFARLGVTATAFALAATGLIAVTGSPAFAVVPLGCGSYSGSAPPAGYNAVNMRNSGNVYISGGGPDFVVGTYGADVIVLTGSDDIVCGLDGADFIETLGGEDEIYAGGGNDEVYAGLGDDFISGGQDSDLLVGDNFAGPTANDGDDEIRGGEGDDDIFGYDGDDTIFGGLNADTGDGGNGNDNCDVDVETPTSC
jgi:Ca2+-binding RTX toxin-like protein